MSRQITFFLGTDASGKVELWETGGTAADTSELAVGANGDSGEYYFPADFTPLDGKILFAAPDAAGLTNLWATNGYTGATTELAVAGASPNGLQPTSFTALNGNLVFGGTDSTGDQNLWVTNGTAAGTSELAVSGAKPSGLAPTQLALINGKVVFNGYDSSSLQGLWVTDGTANGTVELINGANNLQPRYTFHPGTDPSDFVMVNGKLLFGGYGAQGTWDLWSTDGTPGGTTDLAGDAGIGNGLGQSSQQ
jgi:ELWxxDGT repeat protein